MQLLTDNVSTFASEHLWCFTCALFCRRSFTTLCLDSVSNYLVELQTMMNTPQQSSVVSHFKRLQAQLERFWHQTCADYWYQTCAQKLQTSGTGVRIPTVYNYKLGIYMKYIKLSFQWSSQNILYYVLEYVVLIHL